MSAIEAERRAFAATLERVGPDAPTNAGSWTAHDVVAHVVSLDRARGLPTFIGRSMVARGVRLNDLVPHAATEWAIAGVKRRGFGWAIERLRRPPPALLMRPALGAVGLFEVWAHHEDVRRPNGVVREDHPDLTEVVAWLRRYHRVAADDLPDLPPHELAYWLAGRVGGPRPV